MRLIRYKGFDLKVVKCYGFVITPCLSVGDSYNNKSISLACFKWVLIAEWK